MEDHRAVATIRSVTSREVRTEISADELTHTRYRGGLILSKAKHKYFIQTDKIFFSSKSCKYEGLEGRIRYSSYNLRTLSAVTHRKPAVRKNDTHGSELTPSKVIR